MKREMRFTNPRAYLRERALTTSPLPNPLNLESIPSPSNILPMVTDGATMIPSTSTVIAASM